jgi:CRISPR/Cas system Type II protein with McrA/HNH and RuvC-like nuclease domain
MFAGPFHKQFKVLNAIIREMAKVPYTLIYELAREMSKDKASA